MEKTDIKPRLSEYRIFEGVKTISQKEEDLIFEALGIETTLLKRLTGKGKSLLSLKKGDITQIFLRKGLAANLEEATQKTEHLIENPYSYNLYYKKFIVDGETYYKFGYNPPMQESDCEN